MDEGNMSDTVTIFGQFRFNPTSRLLTDGVTPVSLGARAIAILDALLEIPGRLVSKAALLDRAWPGLNVDEANLKVQISALRKALGGHESSIRAEGSLGYRFVGSVTKDDPFGTSAVKHRFHAPRKATTPIGRKGVVSDIVELLAQNRLVTILGSGGIGKTTVALEVANELSGSYADGTCFVDLGRATSGDQVRATITDALHGFVEVAPTIEETLLMLRGKRLLLVLDSAERVTKDVSRLIERVLNETDNTDILVTTRESIRVEGGAIWRLEPLETPPTSLHTTAADIQSYPSIELFVRTARQGAFDCQIDDAAADVIAEVCRRLDGIPLAIELAASKVGVLGIDEVRRRLDERSSLLGMDRRTTVPRQRSMAATIDWSYDLLSETERVILRRLAAFAGPFSLNDAILVASDDEFDETAVREAVVALTNKSFLVEDEQAATPEYRLLKTTRAYAYQAQDPIVERKPADDPRAGYVLDLHEQQEGEAVDPAAGSTNAQQRPPEIEIRVSLNWSSTHEFLLRRLASFHRVREPGAMRAGPVTGSDRSGRIPFA
jgi:predicted ATPase/DNA-binding winged helix-turn-helix (wHTH) protein